MRASHSWSLLVFRDGRRVFAGRDLLRPLLQNLDLLSNSDFKTQPAREELIEALLRSGELECALADHGGSGAAAEDLARLTDQLAIGLVGQSNLRLASELLERLSSADLPESLTVSIPEGFSYYALHPLDYADLLSENAIDTPAAAVVGIRSIGTTLSAIVRAWFELRQIPAERITVRPTGHPFDRRLSLSERDRQWIMRGVQQQAMFFVVDEGPGLSGSSFLAVAEALLRAGVSAERIVLLPSSTPNLSALFASDAAPRWGRFKTLPLKSTLHVPSEAKHDFGCGEWRRNVFAREQDWPGVWPWTERRKFLSANRRTLYRFDGHGHYGKAVRDRAQLLAEHGWGPATSVAGDGFSACPWIFGETPRHADRDTVLHLARYCAFRAAHFELPAASSDELEHMTAANLERALGIPQSVTLPIERPVLADARMMPHEWIATPDRRLLKVDAASHGDDHFYPGPTDIAWDLAGVIVEWKLDDEASELLVSEYKRISGDSIEARLPGYLIAYCAFRLGFTLSAGHSMSDEAESARFRQDAGKYREKLELQLPLTVS